MAKRPSKPTRKVAKGVLEVARRGDRQERDTLPPQVRGAATRKGKSGSKIRLPDEAVVRETDQTVPVARTRKLGKAARQPMPAAAIDRRRFTGDEKARPAKR